MCIWSTILRIHFHTSITNVLFNYCYLVIEYSYAEISKLWSNLCLLVRMDTIFPLKSIFLYGLSSFLCIKYDGLLC
jgi:hypothetical protein